jgi:hypothetical protein
MEYGLFQKRLMDRAKEASDYSPDEWLGLKQFMTEYPGQDPPCPQGVTRAVCDTLNALALFQTCLGKPQEAVALFRKSLGIKPDQPAVVQSINLIEKGPPGER